MGLRLQSKGGAQITSLQRSVLRCDGCSNVCKSQSKLFCPACGHATLSKVSVTVGPDGTEHFGVRKRFTLRGTRCCPISLSGLVLQGSHAMYQVHVYAAIGASRWLHHPQLALMRGSGASALQVLAAEAERGDEVSQSDII